MRNYVKFRAARMIMTVSGFQSPWIAWGADEDDCSEEKGRMIAYLESIGDTVVVNSEVRVDLYLKLDKENLIDFFRAQYGAASLTRFQRSESYIFGTEGSTQDPWWTFDSPRRTWSHNE